MDGIMKLIDFAKGDFKGFLFANLNDFDMLYGHRRDRDGYLKALEEFNYYLPILLKNLTEKDLLIITADHGNAEMMVDEETGKPQTAHTTNEVPFVVINPDRKIELKSDGALCNVAPTVLELLGLDKPEEMDCESLIKA